MTKFSSLKFAVVMAGLVFILSTVQEERFCVNAEPTLRRGPIFGGNRNHPRPGPRPGARPGPRPGPKAPKPSLMFPWALGMPG
uniref:Glycine rich superfamily member n=1 Tax=Rhipicephalus zambeziensis TaxID=60191 RepID=A0A224Z220_9ACAR